MLPRSGDQFDQGDIDVIEACADLAIDAGVPVVHPGIGIVVVPDVTLLEIESEGVEIPPTFSLWRNERCVYLFRWPMRGDPKEAA